MILNNLTSEGMNFSLPKKINSKGTGATCHLQRQSQGLVNMVALDHTKLSSYSGSVHTHVCGEHFFFFLLSESNILK